MLGGVAIFLATMAAWLIFVPATKESLVVVGGSTLLFLWGSSTTCSTFVPTRS